MHILGIFLTSLSYQTAGALTGLVQKSVTIQSLLQKKLLDLEKFPRIAFHEEFSHLPGGLGHFADCNSSSIESAHHLSSNPGFSNVAEVPSFIRLPALAAMPFVSDRWGVEVR